MKKTFLYAGMILSILQGCRQTGYEISNPSGAEQTDLTFVVDRFVVNQYLSDTTKDLPVVVRGSSGNLLPSQCDDVDGDGHWDELAFLCDLKAGETSRVLFETASAQPEFKARTNIRFGRVEKPFEEVTTDMRMKTNDTKFTAPVYQMEGPAWENDVIAFRNYYDARNGVDIYGKRTALMVLDSVGVNGRDYHTLADWGMDILKVGNSLGAGAIAIGIGDSLYRVGPCEEGKYRLICDADLSMPETEIPKFLPPLLIDCDIAIASREAKGAKRYNEPLYRHLVGRVFNFLVRTLVLPGLQDTQCGFKCFKSQAAEVLFQKQTLKGWSFDVEVLFIARLLGYKVNEIPIPWYFNPESKVKVIRDSAQMAFDLFVIRWNSMRGIYRQA